MHAPVISVVIPTRNRLDLIRRTLATILQQDLPSDAYEVIVVSDGSTDGTVSYVSAVDAPVTLRVLDLPHRGPSAARNAGIAVARGTLVLFMDDDMLCEPTLVRRHVAAHAGGDRAVVCGPTRTASDSCPGLATDFWRRWYDEYAERLTREGGARSEYDVWVTSNCSASRSLLAEHGGYAEEFRYAEDGELAIRLWRAGVRFCFLPAAPAYELYSKSASDMVRVDAPRRGVSELQLCRRFPDYARHSIFAVLLGRSRARAFVWRLCATAPVSPEPVLRSVFWVAERLRTVPVVQRIGFRLLAYRTAIAVLRSATGEVGSWAALLQTVMPPADAVSPRPRADSGPPRTNGVRPPRDP